MSDELASAGVRALCASRLALHARFDELRRVLQQEGGAGRVPAARAFEAAVQERADCERRTLFPLLARSSVAGRDARREIEVQHAQLAELARHVHARIAGGAPPAIVLGFVENLARRLEAHGAELDRVYYPAIASQLDEHGRRALIGGA